jgi:molybdopterin synthase catalytic subunit
MDIKTLITEDALSIDEAYRFVQDERYGGTCLFVGSARKISGDQVTEALDFESFDSMALKEMNKIASEVVNRFGPGKCFISHLKGRIEPPGIVVIIAVATAHRKAAFEGCQWAIDTLKTTVPIWKKEILEDGSYWVNAHP